MTFTSPNETSLRTMISGLAESLGWSWMHVRPARTNRPGVWKTPVDGPLGIGWPDLFLVRGNRSLAIETKTPSGALSTDQERVLSLLRHAGIETIVATPATMRTIEDLLR